MCAITACVEQRGVAKFIETQVDNRTVRCVMQGPGPTHALIIILDGGQATYDELRLSSCEVFEVKRRSEEETPGTMRQLV